MRIKTKNSLAAFGLAVSTSPSLFPATQAETVFMADSQPAVVVADLQRLSGIFLASGKVLLKHTTKQEVGVAKVSPTQPEYTWRTDPSISSNERKQLAAKAAYVNKVIVPAVLKHGLAVLEPKDPGVNPPGGFIAYNPDNPECASQFYVHDSLKGHGKNIAVSTWGNVGFYKQSADSYLHAVYHVGQLHHQESTDNFGRDFPANKPSEAGNFTGEIIHRNNQMDSYCHSYSEAVTDH